MSGIGIAVATAAMGADGLWVAHVGDARVYLIRKGKVQRLTKDHTMVNLFIEAELLTPEDALSHPEAHVLSRSLGTDRQVEVEVSGPFPLSEGDRILLCSDGLHRVLSDEELERLHWEKPEEAAEELVETVAALEGEDNVTAVVVAATPSEEDVLTPQTIDHTEDEELPDEEAEEPALQELEDEPSQATLSNSMLAIPATPAPAIARVALEQPTAHAVAPAPSPAKSPPKPKTQKALPPQRVAIGLVAAFVGVVMGGTMVFFGVRLWMGGDQIPDQPIGLRIAETTDGQLVPEPLPVQPIVDSTPTVFAPVLPTEPRRPPHRQEKFLQPPPGSTAQHETVVAARKGECGQSLGTLRKAMKSSVDHGSVYHTVWGCFNDAHQRPLLEARVQSPEAFQSLLVHFEGRWADESPLPYWARPAQNGIEARFEGWWSSGQSDQFADAILDRLGPGVTADHLLRDLWIEASAAAGLAEVGLSNSDPAVEWWARRVYYSQRAWNSPIGDLIRNERPEVSPALEALLSRGVRGLRPEATESVVPPRVHDAWSAAIGLTPVPDAKPRPPPPPPRKVKVFHPADPPPEETTPHVFRAPK